MSGHLVFLFFKVCNILLFLHFYSRFCLKTTHHADFDHFFPPDTIGHHWTLIQCPGNPNRNLLIFPKNVFFYFSSLFIRNYAKSPYFSRFLNTRTWKMDKQIVKRFQKRQKYLKIHPLFTLLTQSLPKLTSNDRSDVI